MNTKQQGDVGVAMAIAYFTKEEYVVSVPLTDNAKYDLLVEKDKVFSRVQCKSSKNQIASGNYEVQLRTSGGNQSWSKIVKRVSKEDCELLFVYTFNGKCYVFEPDVFHEKTTLTMGPKYKKYEVQITI